MMPENVRIFFPYNKTLEYFTFLLHVVLIQRIFFFFVSLMLITVSFKYAES